MEKRRHQNDSSAGRGSGEHSGRSRLISLVKDFRQSPASIRVFVAGLSVLLLLLSWRSFKGIDMYVREPGLDDGFVHARLYSWWGLSNSRYEIAHMRTREGDLVWHVRKTSGQSSWQPLYGPDPYGGLSMWLPR